MGTKTITTSKITEKQLKFKTYFAEEPPKALGEIKNEMGQDQYATAIKVKVCMTAEEYMLNSVDGDTIIVKQIGGPVLKPNHPSIDGKTTDRLCLRLLGINAPEVQHYKKLSDFDKKIKNASQIPAALKSGDGIVNVFKDSDGDFVDIKSLSTTDLRRYNAELDTYEDGEKAKDYVQSVLGVDTNKIKTMPIKSLIQSAEFIIVVDQTQLSSKSDMNSNAYVQTPGQDIYGRWLSVIYCQNPLNKEWMNVNKSELLQGYNTVSYSFVDAYGVRTVSNYFNISDYTTIYSLTSSASTKHTTSTTGTIIDVAVDDRSDILKETGLYDSNLYEWTLMIGDVTLLIPPESIRVSKRTTANRIKTMRSKNSVEEGTGHCETYVEISAYFSGTTMLNGTPYITKLPNGKEITYHVNGLRQLIAQFKKAPFIPIRNFYLNSVYNIEGVCLQNLQIRTVPGFPETMCADMTFIDFEPRTFLYELGGNEHFDEAYNWKAFRYYYQQSFVGPNDVKKYPYLVSAESRGHDYLKPVGSHLNGKLSFSLMQESQINEFAQKIKLMKTAGESSSITAQDILNSNSLPEELYSNYMRYQGLASLYKNMLDAYTNAKKTNSALKLNDYLVYYIEHNDAAKEAFFIKSDKIFGNSGPIYAKLVFDYPFAYIQHGVDWEFETEHKSSSGIKADSKGKAARDAFDAHGQPISGILLSKSVHDRFTKQGSATESNHHIIDFFVDIFRNVVNETISSINMSDKGLYEVPDQMTLEIRLDELNVSSFGKSYTKLQKELMSEYKSTNKHMVSIVNRIISFGAAQRAASDEVSKKINSMKKDTSSQSSYIDELETLKFQEFPVDTVVNSVAISFENTFTPMQFLSSKLPTRQHLGGNDVIINLSLTVTGYENLVRLNTMYDLSLYLVRKYRAYLSDGFIKINNELVNMAGINYVVINDMTVSTMADYPDAYMVQMTLVSFDRTQRDKEVLKRIAEGNNQYIGPASTAPSDTAATGYVDFLNTIRQVELYPDLELPTIVELNNAGFSINAGNGLFPDPDFYISYFKGRTTLAQTINAHLYDKTKATKDSKGNKLNEKIRLYDVNTMDSAVLNPNLLVGDNLTPSTSLKNTITKFSSVLNNMQSSMAENTEKTASTAPSAIPTAASQNLVQINTSGIIAYGKGQWLKTKEVCLFGATLGFTEKFSTRQAADKKKNKNAGANIDKLKNRFDKSVKAPYLDVSNSGYQNTKITVDQMHMYLEKLLDHYQVPSDSTIRGYIHSLIYSESGFGHWQKTTEVDSNNDMTRTIGNLRPKHDYNHLGVGSRHDGCTGLGVCQFNARDSKWSEKDIATIAWNPFKNLELGVRILISKYKVSFGLGSGIGGIYTPEEYDPSKKWNYKVATTQVSAKTKEENKKKTSIDTGIGVNQKINVAMGKGLYQKIDVTVPSKDNNKRKVQKLTTDTGKNADFNESKVQGNVVTIKDTDICYSLSYERARWFYACMLYKGCMMRPDDIVTIGTYISKAGKFNAKDINLHGKNTATYLAGFISAMNKDKYTKKAYDGNSDFKNLIAQTNTVEGTGEADKFYNYNNYPAFEISPDDIFKDSLTDMIEYDKRGRLVRAFPTYFLTIIDEGTTIYNWKLHDNFYGYNSIQSMDVINSRKMIASTCTMQMSNIFDSYWKWDKESLYRRRTTFGEVLDSFFETSKYAEDQDSFRNQDVNMSMLKTGARLHLRMGYGSDCSKLPIKFNGTITEITQGEVMNIVAQGDGIELTNKIPAGAGETLGANSTVENTNPFSELLHKIGGNS